MLAGALTHNDASSIAACVAFVWILWELLAMPKPPSPQWWLDEYCTRAKALEGNVQLIPRTTSLAFTGPIWRLVDSHVRQALDEELTASQACDRWYSGAFLLETVPSAFFILARHGHDPEEAIVRAVNDTRDNDTTAAIVGAAVGALHGRTRLPTRWVSQLRGRTSDNDDGRVFDLVRAAKDKWEPKLPPSP